MIKPWTIIDKSQTNEGWLVNFKLSFHDVVDGKVVIQELTTVLQVPTEQQIDFYISEYAQANGWLP